MIGFSYYDRLSYYDTDLSYYDINLSYYSIKLAQTCNEVLKLKMVWNLALWCMLSSKPL